MKFKVGDKVKIVASANEGEVTEVNETEVTVTSADGSVVVVAEDDLEKVEGGESA